MSFFDNVRTGDPLFEKQFADPDYVDVGGVDAAVIDVMPKRERPGRSPFLLVPGYASDPSDAEYKRAIHRFYDANYRILSVQYPSYGDLLGLREEFEQQATDEQKELIKDCPDEALRRALVLIEALKHKQKEGNFPDVNVIAHSAGAFDAAIAALLRPDLIRNIGFFNPAGLMKKENVGGLVSVDALLQIAKNPPRIGRQGIGLLRAEIHEIIRRLHEKGVGLFVMSAEDDPVFPGKKMQLLLKDSPIGFLPVQGGHGRIGEHVREIEGAFAQIEEDKRRRAQERADAGRERIKASAGA